MRGFLSGVDLFSGIGGLTLALSEWVKPRAYCENDRHCQAVLMSRMRDGRLPFAPVWDDIKTFKNQIAQGEADIIYGGFPCQDISVAGNGVGLEGKRSGLFFEILRLIDEIKPPFVFLENVPAIRTRGGERVGKELARRGYDCRWDVISAAEVGAPHLRKRWFLLAHANRERREVDEESNRQAVPKREVQNGNDFDGLRDTIPDAGRSELWGEQRRSRGKKREGQALVTNHGPERSLAYTALESERKPSHKKVPISNSRQTRKNPSSGSWWAVEPDVGRVAHGIPDRVDRLRALGNAVVPAQAREAFVRLVFDYRRLVDEPR